MNSSGLSRGSFTTPEEVVRWHGAMQAQDYGPAKWSIGQRAADLVDPDVDRAVIEGSIVRTHVLRPTWHFVARDDVRRLLALTGPRVHQHNLPRYRQLGLDERTLARCEAVIVSALEGGRHLTREHIARILDQAGIDRSGQRLPHILLHCELQAAICSGAPKGRHQTYALLDERVPQGHRFDRDDALIELVRRYVTSRGPATVQDLRWWSSLTAADIRRALRGLGSEVNSESIDGVTLWSHSSQPARLPPARGAHLLQAYDELVVGYTESRYFGDERAATARAAWRDRRLPSGIVLLHGGVGGHWRRRVGQDSVTIEVLLHERPQGGDARALEAGARALGRFLQRRVVLHERVI
jgi:hypothetical protein